MTFTRKPAFVLRVAERAAHEHLFSHPWNPRSELRGVFLSRVAGLERTGISFATLPPGKESFAYHSHAAEEEWIFILSGAAVAEVDGGELALGPGDFLAFPVPSVAHNRRNDGDRPVEYLMGGETRDCEIADFPRLGRRMLRAGGVFRSVRFEEGETIDFARKPTD